MNRQKGQSKRIPIRWKLEEEKLIRKACKKSGIDFSNLVRLSAISNAENYLKTGNFVK